MRKMVDFVRDGVPDIDVRLGRQRSGRVDLLKSTYAIRGISRYPGFDMRALAGTWQDQADLLVPWVQRLVQRPGQNDITWISEGREAETRLNVYARLTLNFASIIQGPIESCSKA